MPDDPSCDLCGGRSYVAWRRVPGGSLIRCRGCGLIRVAELPTGLALRRVYDEPYFRNPRSGELGYTDYDADAVNIRRTLSARLRAVRRVLRPEGDPPRAAGTPPRLLDVGCATGIGLEAAAALGFAPEGIEISAWAAAVARARGPFPVVEGELPEAGFPPARFDVITMWDVIEHVREPSRYLAACARLLRPGGVLAVTTPDVGSLVARTTGRRWIGYKHGVEHLHYFSRGTLTAVLRRAGFSAVAAWPAGKHVRWAVLAERLGCYLPAPARWLAAVARRLGFADASLYANALDIVCVIARRRAAAPTARWGAAP